MFMDADLHIRTADRSRDGVLVAFSDGVVVLFPTTFLLASRDLQEITRVAESDEE